MTRSIFLMYKSQSNNFDGKVVPIAKTNKKLLKIIILLNLCETKVHFKSSIVFFFTIGANFLSANNLVQLTFDDSYKTYVRKNDVF